MLLLFFVVVRFFIVVFVFSVVESAFVVFNCCILFVCLFLVVFLLLLFCCCFLVFWGRGIIIFKDSGYMMSERESEEIHLDLGNLFTSPYTFKFRTRLPRNLRPTKAASGLVAG